MDRGGGGTLGGEKLNGVRNGVNNCRQVLFRDTLLKHGDSVLSSTAYFPKVARALKWSQVRSPSCIDSLLGSQLRPDVVQEKRLHSGSDPMKSMSPRERYLPNTKKGRPMLGLKAPGQTKVIAVAVALEKKCGTRWKFPKKTRRKGGGLVWPPKKLGICPGTG